MNSHPLPKVRKANLFNYLRRKHVLFLDGEETEKAKIVYKDFASTIKLCISEMLIKRRDGSLKDLCDQISKFPTKIVYYK